MKNSEIVEHVQQALRLCAGYDNNDEAADRESALDYYFMRPRGDEAAGRSQVVSGDLSAMVEAVLAMAMDAFSTTRIVELDSFGVADDDQAALESDAVEWFVMKKANGLMIFQSAIKDMLLLRNGIVKVWVERKSETESRELEGVEPEIIGELTNIPNAKVDAVRYDSAAKKLRLRITTESLTLRIDLVAIENFVYLDGWTSHDLQEIPICAERHVSTRSEMVDDFGFSKDDVYKLQPYRHEYKADATARDTQKHQHDRSPLDESQVTVEWYECYVLMDLNGDGISERHMIAVDAKGSTLLKKEARTVVPYAGGTCILNPHRFKGVSLYDKLRQVQDINTGLYRALLDNVNTVLKNRTAGIDGKVEPSDLEDGRPNGHIRVRGVQDVRQAITGFAVPDQSQGILENIRDQRGVRAELGGASLELATGNMQLNDRLGSQGLDRAYSVMEQLASLMLKNAAHTLILNVFLLAHRQLRENFTQPVPIKPNGKWVSPIPSSWPRRECATVRIGMSPGERARKAATLRGMMDDQVALAREGMTGILVSPSGFYKSAMDWARVSDIPNPEQYYIDPDTPEAQEALQSQRESQQQLQQAQAALVAQAVQLEQMGKALEKYRHDSELQFKYFKEVLGAEVEEAKLVGKATTDLTLKQMEGNERDDTDNDNAESAGDDNQQETDDNGGRSSGDGGDSAGAG